jgi:hypothetical protein
MGLMTAKAARSTLDRMLAQYGELCQLQRTVSGAVRSVALRASIKDYKPDELTGGNGLMAGDSRATISTTEINAESWPSAALIVTTTAGDPRIPVKGDKLVLSNGRVRIVQAAWPAPYVDGELVRIELTIR